MYSRIEFLWRCIFLAVISAYVYKFITLYSPKHSTITFDFQWTWGWNSSPGFQDTNRDDTLIPPRNFLLLTVYAGLQHNTLFRYVNLRKLHRNTQGRNCITHNSSCSHTCTCVVFVTILEAKPYHSPFCVGILFISNSLFFSEHDQITILNHWKKLVVFTKMIYVLLLSIKVYYELNII